MGLQEAHPILHIMYPVAGTWGRWHTHKEQILKLERLVNLISVCGVWSCRSRSGALAELFGSYQNKAIDYFGVHRLS